MKTYKIDIKELEGKEILAVGYKAMRYDGGCMQGAYKYGDKDEKIVGTAHTVDGDIAECKWGLHFSRDPANVFNFYEPLGYNRYFKVAAYDKIVETKDGIKTVAKTLVFLEEYDIMEYVDMIKRYDRSVKSEDAVSSSTAVRSSTAVSSSTAVRSSTAVSSSDAVSGSTAVSDSTAVRFSTAVSSSTAVRSSTAVSSSDAVRSSTAVSESYGIYNSEAVKNCLFCYKVEGAKYKIFNKRSTKARFEEIYRKIIGFGYFPKYDNFYDLKGHKEWYTVAFPELMSVDNATAWSKMPKEMDEYIRSLPEFNEKIYNKIIGNEGDE